MAIGGKKAAPRPSYSYHNSAARVHGGDGARRQRRLRWRFLLLLLFLVAIMLVGYHFWSADSGGEVPNPADGSSPDLTEQPGPGLEPEPGLTDLEADLTGDGAPERVVLRADGGDGRYRLEVYGRTESGWQLLAQQAVQSRRQPTVTLAAAGPDTVLVADPPALHRLFRFRKGSGLAELDYYRLTAPEVDQRGDLIIVDKGKNVLYLYREGRLVWHARVATGIDQAGPPELENSFTPVGSFAIANKRIDPPWTSIDGQRREAGGAPTNPLGTRWLGFQVYDWDGGNVWGIHGTDQPESIGHNASDGCIRLRNADVEQLYDMVRVGTALRIIDSPLTQ